MSTDTAVAMAPAPAAPPWPRTVKLGTPVEFGKETITELVFQRGTVGIMKGIALAVDHVPNIDEVMVIACRLAGCSQKVIESLDPDDFAEVMAIALGFFNRCLMGGSAR